MKNSQLYEINPFIKTVLALLKTVFMKILNPFSKLYFIFEKGFMKIQEAFRAYMSLFSKRGTPQGPHVVRERYCNTTATPNSDISKFLEIVINSNSIKVRRE